eukprot:403355577
MNNSVSTAISGNFMSNQKFSEEEKQAIIKHIDELKISEKRDNALIELSRQREHFTELAPFIWHSVGTIAALLQEIIAVYPQLSPPNLDTKTSNKACNVLALLQCVASHKETKQLFLRAHIPLFLYPFLNTVSKGRPFEYLRLTSLGVIGALVKMDDPEVISFLLQTEIIPLCLRIMERGTELSQTVATFIIQKILFDDQGLNYLCQTAERFFAVSTVLNNMVNSQIEKPSQRLLKHIVRCYNRLSENIKARVALRENMPIILKESKIYDSLDESTRKCLKNLSDQLSMNEKVENSSFQQEMTPQSTIDQRQLQMTFSNYEMFKQQPTPTAEQQQQSIPPIIFPQQLASLQNAQVQIISRPQSSASIQMQPQATPFQRMNMVSPPPFQQNINIQQVQQAKIIQPIPQNQTQQQFQAFAMQQQQQQYRVQGMNQNMNFIPQMQSPHQPHLQMQNQNPQYQQSQFYQQYGNQSNMMYNVNRQVQQQMPNMQGMNPQNNKQ